MAKRIVVMTPNWLGDAVLAFPALGAIRRHHPADTLVIAARSSTSALFRMVSGVDEVVEIGTTRPGTGVIGDRPGDIAILLPNSFRSAWVARRAGIPERWGYAGDLRRLLLTRAVPRPAGRRHQSDYYNCLVAALGMPADGPAVRLVVPEEARSKAAALLEAAGVPAAAPVVGIAPGAAYGHAKQWQPERFGRVADLLHQRAGVVSVLLGSPADRGAVRDIPAGPHVADLVGRTDLTALAGVMTRCRAFLSNDSGAMHMASAAGVPVTAVFGPTDEKATAPLPLPSVEAPRHEILTCNAWCRPCMLRECPIDHRCMTGIDPVRVCEAIERQLNGRQP